MNSYSLFILSNYIPTDFTATLSVLYYHLTVYMAHQYRYSLYGKDIKKEHNFMLCSL